MASQNCDIRIGTSGYDYPEWKGVLYPDDSQKDTFLSLYSQHYDTLELNFSYYGMPKRENIEKMLSRANGSMDFSIKGYYTLTHRINPSTWEDDVKEFIKGIEPLAIENRLAAILFEFPYSFHYQPGERLYLEKLINAFAGFPIVIELRNKEWYIERVFNGLRERNVSLCLIDAPTISKVPVAKEEMVAPQLAYIRLHGRNEETWWEGSNVTRYDYLYNENELSDWVLRVDKMKETTKKIRIYFNNHAKGNAVKNANELKNLIKQVTNSII